MQLIYWLIGNFPMIAPLPPILQSCRLLLLTKLQERYYGIVEKLETLHADPSKAAAKTFAYDADHERRRKEQLCRLYDRTPEQVEEEEILRAELKKVKIYEIQWFPEEQKL